MHDENLECPDLCGIFYSIFNDSLGRIIAAQFPVDFFSPESFREIDNFVITKEDFSNRVSVSEVCGKIVIGCLQFLENINYPRNKFLFNVCFVVRDTCNNIIAYENLVRNVNRFFYSLEQETGALHSANPSMIGTCLENIYSNLRRHGMCKYTWEGFGTIYIKISTTPFSDVIVDKEQVPVYMSRVKERLVPLDLACQRLSSALDGSSTIYEVAKKSQVDLKVAIACVQNLGQIGALKTVAQYRPSSTYLCLPRLSLLTRDANLDQRLLEHLLGAEAAALNEADASMVVNVALRALAVLTPATKAQDCAEVLAANYHRLDCKLLIQFAELEGLIRRLHCHPLAGPDALAGLNRACGVTEDMLDGTHSLEEISCLLDVPVAQLEADFSKIDDLYLIMQ